MLNPEPAKQELQPLRTGDGGKLGVALKSKLIKDADIEDLKERLRYVMVKVGLRAQNFPNDIEKLVLIEHIRDNFGGNTLEEIKLAFDMAIGYKLDLDEKEISCYENFSCLYFSKIMNAYREWSTQEYQHLKPEQPPVQRIFTPEELDDGLREDVERQYSLFVKGHPLKGLEFNLSILEKDGLIEPGENVVQFFIRKASQGFLNIYTKH